MISGPIPSPGITVSFVMGKPFSLGFIFITRRLAGGAFLASYQIGGAVGWEEGSLGVLEGGVEPVRLMLRHTKVLEQSLGQPI